MDSPIASADERKEPASPRLLDYWEGRFAAIHALYAGAGMIIVPAVVSGPLTPELLEAALDRMVGRWPLLRARLQLRPPARLVIDAARRRLPLRILPTTPQPPMESLAEAEATLPLGAREWLWRITMAPGGEQHGVLLTIQHAIFDGRSIAVFFDELLAEAAGILEGAPPRQEFPLPPRPSTCLPVAEAPAAWEEALRLRDREYGELAPWPWEVTLPAREGIHRNRLLWMEADEVTRLRSAARGADVTLNSLLASAVIEAAVAIGRPPPWRILTPVNLRDDCSPPVLDHLGCFVSTLGIQVADEPDLLERARLYQARLRHLRATAPLLPRDGSTVPLERRPPPGHFLPEIFLSNLGVLRVPRRGPFHLESLSFATSRRAGDSPLVVHALTLHGRLGLCTSYLSPHLGDERAATFCAHLGATLAAVT